MGGKRNRHRAKGISHFFRIIHLGSPARRSRPWDQLGRILRSNRTVQFFLHLNLQTIRATIAAVAHQRLLGLAAEMAYNAMLSLFPAILAVLTAIGLFKPLTATFETLAEQTSQVAPSEVLGLIENFTNAISDSRDGRLFSFSFVFAIWVASGALSAAMAALDQIHKIPPSQRRPFWKAKLVALGLTIGSIFLLILAVALIFLSEVAVRHLAQQSGELSSSVLRLWRLFTLPLALGTMSALFAFIYRFGPSRWNSGKPIMPGAILAAIFWAILSNLFRHYVQDYGNYNQVYGAVGAVIILLIWLQMSSFVLLVGDQLNVTVGEAILQSKQRSDNP